MCSIDSPLPWEIDQGIKIVWIKKEVLPACADKTSLPFIKPFYLLPLEEFGLKLTSFRLHFQDIKARV